jgi:hypothetical protein
MISADLEVETALRDSASLELTLQQAIDGGGTGEEMDQEVDEEDQEEEDDRANEGGSAMDWVDNFILNTRRKGGRQTETSVVKLYKVRTMWMPVNHPFSLSLTQVWLLGALRDELVPDDIIDANHIIHYLKYAATRRLLTKRGEEKETDDCLSVSSPALVIPKQSLKKIVAMLGRISLVHT